jgi:NAD-dependent SIR2 family protein deacetylase
MMVEVSRESHSSKEEVLRLQPFRRFLQVGERVYPDLRGIVAHFDRTVPEYMWYPPNTMRKSHYVDELLKVVHGAGDTAAVSLTRQLIAEHLLYAAERKDRSRCSDLVRLLEEGRDTSVISLNFDCLLEEGGLDCHYGFTDFAYGGSLTGQVPLLKLHGSLNWGICCGCGTMGIVGPRHPHPLFYRTAKCPVCSGVVEPYILVPHIPPATRLRAIWACAEEAIASARELVVVGYSLPNHDHAVCVLLTKLQPDAVITAVDVLAEGESERDAEARVRSPYAHLGLGERVRIMLGGLEGYIARAD